MSENRSYTSIAGILKDLRSRMAVLELFKGLLLTAASAIILGGFLIGITAASWPPAGARVAIDAAAIILLTAILYLTAVRPYTRPRSFLQIARMLEKHYGAFQTRLIAALELYDLAAKNRENYSIELIEKTIDEAGGFIAEIDTDVIIDRKPLKSSVFRTAALALVFATVALLNPGLAGQTWRLYSAPGANFTRPPDFALHIVPRSGEYFRNQDLTVEVTTEGKTPDNVDLYFKFDDGEWARESMRVDSQTKEPSFEYTFKKIQRSLDAYASSGRVKSETVRLEVVDPPRLVNINVNMEFPRYTGLPDAMGEPNDGNVVALKGSTVHLRALANKPLSRAFQVFADSTRVPLELDGAAIAGDFSVKGDSRYTIAIYDEAGRENPEPIWYDIQSLEDYPPSIQIVFPGTDVDLNEKMILPLDVAISDDYGFGKLNLVWWIVSEGKQTEPSKEDLKIADPRTVDQTVGYKWDINRVDPLPGDLIYYYCEVSDNDVVSGPKWARSRTFIARLPRLDEILAEVDDSQQNQIDELSDVVKNQEELQKKINDISREMLKATQVDWQKQQAARETLEKQQNLAERMQKLARDMQENLDRLQENSLIGEEIAEKMREMQSLMDQVATPELKEAMQKLQEALQKLDPDALRKALEDFKMTSQELLENLDRSLSLLKQLAIEQKMDLLTQLAQKILEEQQNINKKVDAARDSADLAQSSGRCEKNSGQFDSLKDQFEQLKQMDADLNMVPQREKNAADQQINNPQIPADFQSMFESMCQGGGGQCSKKGKSLEKNLDNVLKALQMAQAAMQQQMKNDIAQKLQKVADDLLYLSQRQESLIDSTTFNKEAGSRLRELAGDQTDLESGAKRAAETVSDISKKTVFININLLRLLGELLDNLGDATGYLDSESPSQATTSQVMAMSDMNTIVLMMYNSKKNVMNSCSGSGMSEMMKKLSEIAEGQSSLNSQCQNLMPIPGQKMSLSQQNSLAQLAAQQDALRRQLEELNDQMGQRNDMLGRLDDLAKEMKEVAGELAEKRAGRRTLERQERILSRLLDAQKSVNRREYSNRRKAEQGDDVFRKSPTGSGDDAIDAGWLSRIVESALKENYPRRYDRLIKAYFKSLQNEGSSIEH